MKVISNTEDIIEFDPNAYVRITDTQFEYHSGVVNDFEFIVPIKNIRRIAFKDSKISKNLGCNMFVAFLSLLIGRLNNNSEPFDLQFLHRKPEYQNAILTLRYKTEQQKRWVSRDISWPGLTKEKGEKIIQILKFRNKNLP